MTQWKTLFTVTAMGLLVLPTLTGCNRSENDKNTIKITGSDTMVNLAQAWSEAYKKKQPDVSIQVKGGGSGVGIKNLSEGKIEIATSSRKMKDKEIELAEKNTGKKPQEVQVGIDALAIAVHKDNPIESMTIADLAAVYGEEGTAQKWSDLGVDNTACADGGIVSFGRQNSSGTYQYFKEAVLGEKGEYRQGISQQSGSSEVVEVLSTTPCGIGYTGMGYLNDHVKVVKITKEKGGEGVAPSIETATDGSYPISRPLFVYTLGDPSPAVKAFIDWTLSDEGQQIVQDLGYVPMPKSAGAADDKASE